MPYVLIHGEHFADTSTQTDAELLAIRMRVVHGDDAVAVKPLPWSESDDIRR